MKVEPTSFTTPSNKRRLQTAGRAIRRVAVDSATLAIKVVFVTAVSVSTIMAMKKVVTTE